MSRNARRKDATVHGVHKQHPGAQDTHYPSSSGICKLQDNIIKSRLVPGTFPQVCLRDQIVPAILQLLALQKQVTLDFKYFIHFLTPTYLNTSIYWVKPGRLPPGGSALASSKYQLGNKYVLTKDLRMHFLNLFLCELYPRQTDSHTQHNKEQLQKTLFFKQLPHLGWQRTRTAWECSTALGWLLGVISPACPITWWW